MRGGEVSVAAEREVGVLLQEGGGHVEDAVERLLRADADADTCAEVADGERLSARRDLEGVGPLAQGEPDEVALRLRDGPPLCAERVRERVALGGDLTGTGEHLVVLVQGDERGRLADLRDAERYDCLEEPLDDRFVRDRVSHAHPGEPVRLGERPHEDEVRVGVQQLEAAGGVRVGRELPVRLVERDDDVRRDAREEGRQLRVREDGARGVVGGAEEHEAGGIRDGVGHRP